MLSTNEQSKLSKKGKERMKTLARKHDPHHVPNPNYKITKAEPDSPTTKTAQDNNPSPNNSSNNQQATKSQKSGNNRKSKHKGKQQSKTTTKVICYSTNAAQ